MRTTYSDARVGVVDSHHFTGCSPAVNTWTNRENFGTSRNTLFIEVYERFLKEHIEIPFQQIDIHLKEYSPEPQADMSC